MYVKRYKNTITKLSSYINYVLEFLQELQSFLVLMFTMIDRIQQGFYPLIFIGIGFGIEKILGCLIVILKYTGQLKDNKQHAILTKYCQALKLLNKLNKEGHHLDVQHVVRLATR